MPGLNDSVLIGDSCTITVDTDATIRSLIVGQGNSGVLQFEPMTARALTVNGNVTIAAGGTIQSAATGTMTGHLLSVGANLIVDGTLDFSTNDNLAGAHLRFVGAASNTFSGSGPVADLRYLTLSKGEIGNVLEIIRPFTVRGEAASDPRGFVSSDVYIGTLKISGTFAYSSVVFPAPGSYSIPGTGGFWLDNPNFTVVGLPNPSSVTGLLRVSKGIYNIGTAYGHTMFLYSGSRMIVDGGSINITGALSVLNSSDSVAYIQSGGTVTVSTVGLSSGSASFDLGTSSSSSFTMRGGTIIVRNPNTATTGARDYRVATGYYLLTGGTLQFGDAASGTAKTFAMGGASSSVYTWFPHLVVSNASAGHTVQLVLGPVYGLSATLDPSTTLSINGFSFAVSGDITNNGTITGTASNSRLWFYYGDRVQTLSGSGAFTAPLNELRIESPSGVSITHTNPVTALRVSLVRGTVTNSNRITLGNGGTTAGTTQIGDSGSPYAGGSYDVSPTFNAGSSGIRVEYAQEGAPRTTGFEIPASRSLAGVTINNTSGVTLAGGDLTITSFLTLSNGTLSSSAGNTPILATTISVPPAGAVASWVNGPLAIQVNTASNVGRTFGIGSPWGWRPVVLANFHSGGTPQTYTAEVIEGSTAGTPTAPLVYLNPVRYVRLQNTANLFSTTTANVRLSYNAAEPVGSTATARVAQSATPSGTYVSRGGTTSASPMTGITSSTAITRGEEYFVLANEAPPPSPPANDTCAAPVVLSLNTPVSGTTIDARDDYELTGATCFTSQGQLGNTESIAAGRDVVFSFTAPASGHFSFRIANPTLVNSVLYVASSCPSSTFPTPLLVGTCLSAANRRTTGAEEVACQFMTAGETFYAIVDENPASGAAFEIEVTACDLEADPNGSPALANPLTCGKEGSLGDRGDLDYFSLGAPGSGSRVFAMLDAIAAVTDQTRLRLTNTTDTYEFDDDDGDANFGSFAPVLSGAVAPSGPAYLQVSTTSTNVQPYRLYALVQPPLASAASETEPNDVVGSANSASNNYFTGTVASSSDADFYSFTAAAGDLVFLGMDCDANRDGTAVDGVLSLVAADGSTVLVTVNGSRTTQTPTPNPGTGLSATTPQFAGEGLVYRVRTGGTYYAKVAGTPGSGTPGQDYALSISLNCLIPGSGADLVVSQTADTNPASGGSSVTYTVTATNNGPSTAASVSVTDTIPANMTFLSASAPGGWSCGAASGGQVVCSAAGLSASASANLLFTYRADYCTGNIQTTHTSTVSSATSDPAAGNNSSSIHTDITDSLDCDDGRSCTEDSCDPRAGCLNEAGNAGAVCRPSSGLACDTAEVCDGVNGACPPDTTGRNAAVGQSVLLSDTAGTTTIAWAGEPDPPFNVYRGTGPGGGPWSYSHTCFDGGVAETSTTDTTMPAAGAMYYYLVSRSSAPCAESSLGETSDGSERPNASPCP